MKKVTKVIAILIVLVATTITAMALTRDKAARTGDITGDGIVSESDLYLVQQHILGVIELTETEQLRADTNKDGKIDIVDLANIQKIILEVK